MPILENIKVAEKEAEALRENAKKTVEDLLEETRLSAINQAKEIIDQAHKTIQLEKKKTDELIKKLEKENLELIEKTKQDLDKQASKNNEVGVNYILKQVVKI